MLESGGYSCYHPKPPKSLVMRECLNHADYECNAEAHRKTRVEKYQQEKRATGTK